MGFEVVWPENYLSELLETPFEDICVEALDEAAPELVKSVKTAIIKAGHVDSGELAESIESNKAHKAKSGAFIVNVFPAGYSKRKTFEARRKGKKTGRVYKVSNAAKLVFLEYGVNGKQTGRPLLGKATRGVREIILKIIEKVYKNKVGAE